MTSGVSDGGPSEMMGMHKLARDFFPNMNHVTRDRAHRARSIQKGSWGLFNDFTGGLLGALATEERSLCRTLQTSLKYSRLFQDVQRTCQSKDKFEKVVRNFSFAAQRFDSLALPLMKVVHLLPVVYKFLTRLTDVGDLDDQKWACSLLSRLTGPEAYRNILRAALASDAMLVGHSFIRFEDAAEGNPLLKGAEALHICFVCLISDMKLCLLPPACLLMCIPFWS